MSEEPKTTEQDEVLDPKTPATAIKIRTEVKEEVARLVEGGEVRRRVVAEITESEIQRRTSELATVLAKRSEIAKELNKIKPDSVTFDDTGILVSNNYSREMSKNLKEAKARLGKIDAALNKAIDKADFQSLQKFLGGGNN